MRLQRSRKARVQPSVLAIIGASTQRNEKKATATSTETMKTLMKPYLTGEREFPQDVKDILSKPGVTADAQNLAAAALLAKFAGKTDK